MSPKVVALVPAKDRADLVGDTVRALIAMAAIDEVLVIDDGSGDATADVALASGATVLRLPRNVGKGAAVTAGVEATPDADVYLMVDADTAATAATTAALLPPVLSGEVDMTIAVPPAADGRGGFGWVKTLSGWGIDRACGFTATAPLSGQRAIAAPLLRRLLPLAPRFGLETALTIDAIAAGARVREIEAPIEHRHTGRSVAGFRHRAGQGIDIVAALWSRLTSARLRRAAIGAVFVVATSALLWSGSHWEASSRPLGARPSKVVIVGLPYVDMGDVNRSQTPNLVRLIARGAVGAMSVQIYSSHPTPTEAYATLAAGVRDRGVDHVGVAAVDAPRHFGLAEVLAEARHPPLAIVSGPHADGAAVHAALAGADLVVVDSEGAGRGGNGDPHTTAAVVARADALVGDVADTVGPDTMLVVASVTPRAGGAHVVPIVVVGPGVPHGYLHSPSTKRVGIVTITDLAPTVLDAFGAPIPSSMVGQPLRYQVASPDLGMLRTVDRDSVLRDRIGNPITVPFVIFQVLVYLLVAGLFAFRGGAGRLGRGLRLIVLAIAALPLAALIFRVVPGMSAIGPASVSVLFALDALVVAVALRARRHALSPLSAIMTTTAVVLVVDVATGVHILTSSYIGYSLSGAGRFFGLGNAAFAVLASCAILAGCIHLYRARRRSEAVVAVSLAWALVFIADTAPTMGDDVGGALTLVPTLGLALWVLWGRRITWRTLVAAAVATVAAVAAIAAIDASRAPHQQTHVARFLTGVRSGGGGMFSSTLTRRMANNLHALEASFWTAIVPLLVLGLIYLILRSPRWGEVIPAGPLRVGAVAAFSAGILGFLANDSGVIVPALVFVFVGPFATLLALDHEAGPPQLIEPHRSSDRAPSAAVT